MKGKLIVLDASDGCGKDTQTEKLYHRLAEDGFMVKKVKFPNYDSPSSSLIKMYLDGSFGAAPSEVDPYITSTFYTVDRYATYKKDWESFYSKGGIVIADRYTTSNMVHQTVKFTDPEAKNSYLQWLQDFEYRLFQLPQPDCVVFLDMPPEFSRKLLAARAGKTDRPGKDIHENNEGFMIQSYYSAMEMAARFQWARVACVTDGVLRNIEDIHEEVYSIVKSVLKT